MKFSYLILYVAISLINGKSVKDSFTEKESWLEQKLDHFNDSDRRTWKMRYLESDTFYQHGQPLFISVGGEWSVTSKNGLLGIIYEISMMFNGYFAYTEHRYYGLSWPVPDMSIENMQYLSTKQALADLAHFIRYKKANVPGLASSKVILFGCSYAGTMTTYFKREYPDLVDGIWASGAPLLYRLDYSDGAISVGQSLRILGGDQSYDRIANMSDWYLTLKKSNDRKILPELKKLGLDKEFDEMKAIISTHVQHRNTTKMKEILGQMMSLDYNDLIGFGKFLKKQRGKIPIADIPVNVTTFEINSFERQWLYQSCNEYANFDTTSSMHQPFGNAYPFDKQVERCKINFGSKYTLDYINAQLKHTMEYYGGLEPNITNYYFTLSELDPWRFTAAQKLATIIPDIGHCQEFKERRSRDLPETKAAKEKGIELIRSWIN